jgi:hypothetical protein
MRVALLSRRHLGAALGTVCGHDEFAFGTISQVDDGTQHFGNHVAGLAGHHGVADQHPPLRLTSAALCRVASPPSIRRPHRRHERERRDPPNAADVDPDVEQLGLHLVGSYL